MNSPIVAQVCIFPFSFPFLDSCNFPCSIFACNFRRSALRCGWPEALRPTVRRRAASFGPRLADSCCRGAPRRRLDGCAFLARAATDRFVVAVLLSVVVLFLTLLTELPPTVRRGGEGRGQQQPCTSSESSNKTLG